MREAEAPADQAAVSEEFFYLFRRRVGGDVEILRVPAQQQVAHRAADQARPETVFVQSVQHAQRAAADVLARDTVLRAREYARRGQGCGSGFRAVGLQTFRFRWGRCSRQVRYTSVLSVSCAPFV